MEEFYKIHYLKRRKPKKTNYYQENLKNDNQIETKIIKRNLKKNKHIKLNQNKDIKDKKKKSHVQKTHYLK